MEWRNQQPSPFIFKEKRNFPLFVMLKLQVPLIFITPSSQNFVMIGLLDRFECISTNFEILKLITDKSPVIIRFGLSEFDLATSFKDKAFSCCLRLIPGQILSGQALSFIDLLIPLLTIRIRTELFFVLFHC